MKNHRRNEAEIRRLEEQYKTEHDEFRNVLELLLFFLPLIIILAAIIIFR